MSATPPPPADVHHSQSGLIGVGAVIGLALAALLVALLLAAFEADSAHFGRVPVPSFGQAIELPGEEIDVYYTEDVELDDDLTLAPPADLDLDVTDAAGAPVRVDRRSGDSESVEGGTTKLAAAVFAPEEGTYTVSVKSSEAAQRADSELTFGQTPFQAVADRFDSIVDELRGPTGIVVLAVLVLLALLPRLRRALRSREQH